MDLKVFAIWICNLNPPTILLTDYAPPGNARPSADTVDYLKYDRIENNIVEMTVMILQNITEDMASVKPFLFRVRTFYLSVCASIL